MTFERLISTCEETRESFQQAAAAAEDGSVRRLLNLYAQQRTRFAEELLQEIYGTAQQGADGINATRSAGKAASHLANGSDLELLRQCLQMESKALESYKDALGTGIPTRAHFLVSAQHSLMQKAHERMQGMLADAGHTGTRMHLTAMARTAL